jgi:Icc protein
MRLAWLTDIHLNFVTPAVRLRFARALARALARAAVDGVIVTGDIGEADSFAPLLDELACAVARPVWFVLGNHDFYGGAIHAVRDRARTLTAEHAWLRWLPACGTVSLTDEVALVGHDGWGDARLGNAAHTNIELSDFHLIENLRLERSARTRRLNALGDEAAAYLRSTVREALAPARHVVVATHVPPFREACWHEGQMSDDDWVPYFACAAVGDVLRQAMLDHPGRRMTVLCGHTHGAGVADVLPNLRVLTGGAEYGVPVVQDVLRF